MVDRRGFMVRGAAAVLGAMAGGGLNRSYAAGSGEFGPFPASGLPSRKLGNTGADVSLLTFGAGGRWAGMQEDEALRVLTIALQRGVNSIDTAYGYGRSEELIGKIMPDWRGRVLLHTKVSTRDPDEWWRHFETSLKRLDVEYVDTLMIHHLGDSADMEKLEAPGGGFELLHRAKEQKLCRWIGVSSHTDWRTLLEAHRRHEFDHVMVSLNVATNGYTDLGFEEHALPALRERNVAVTAMKALGAGKIVDAHPAFDYRTCLRYTLSLQGVHSVTVTMPNLQHMSADVECVAGFEPLAEDDLRRLKQEASGEVREAFIDFMRGHRDCEMA